MAYSDDEQFLVTNLTVSPSLLASYYVVNVTILDDDVHEEDESVELEFHLLQFIPFSGYLPIADPVLTVVIIEDDDAPRKYSREEIYSRYYTTT